MIALIEQHREELAGLCRRFRVERLDLFGSAAKGTFNPEKSDLDFIVAFQNPDADDLFDRYFGLAESLESLFQKPIDLITDRPFENRYFAKSVAESRRTLYERRDQEIPA